MDVPHTALNLPNPMGAHDYGLDASRPKVEKVLDDEGKPVLD